MEDPGMEILGKPDEGDERAEQVLVVHHVDHRPFLFFLSDGRVSGIDQSNQTAQRPEQFAVKSFCHDSSITFPILIVSLNLLFYIYSSTATETLNLL